MYRQKPFKTHRADCKKDLRALLDKGKITAEKRDDILGRIQFVSAISQCRADVVIEAIVEKPDVKISLFNQLAAINKADTIFASNTSSLSISTLAKGVPHPERMAGLHFFNPAPLMKLVEVIKGEQTSEPVVSQLVNLTKSWGKFRWFVRTRQALL
jgi:3-hydroxybutyryl-CoA dehydrogenase